jgi:hypothetical protein
MRRRNLILLLALHALLVAFYTLPASLIPVRLRIIGQLYARPLFHQQWRLFAPDPPLCSCAVELSLGEEEWRPLTRQDDGYLDRRMAQSIARNVQRALAAGAQGPDAPTAQAMRAMVSDIGREQGAIRFRLVEHCVTDPFRPSARIERITPLP